MSNLADSDEILGADDSRLVDAQDLVLMLFPNVAGNDKGGAMTFAQFAARLEGVLDVGANRNGGVTWTALYDPPR